MLHKYTGFASCGVSGIARKMKAYGEACLSIRTLHLKSNELHVGA
jgi:hypothetical protein